jgi:hypothetical protein
MHRTGGARWNLIRTSRLASEASSDDGARLANETQNETREDQNAPDHRGTGAFCLVRAGGQGRDRTADLPLFRRLCRSIVGGG